MTDRRNAKLSIDGECNLVADWRRKIKSASLAKKYGYASKASVLRVIYRHLDTADKRGCACAQPPHIGAGAPHRTIADRSIVRAPTKDMLMGGGRHRRWT